MDDQQAGLWQMIMGLIGRGKPQPKPQGQPVPQQGDTTRNTVAAPNRQAYLEYATAAASRGDEAMPYTAWLQEQRRLAQPQQ